MLTKTTLFIRILLITGIVILLNIVMSRFFFRLDFTADQRYTLSNATEDILNDLDKTVTVNAYFSENLPSQLQKNARDFRDMLTEYANESGGNVVYEFINPNESPEIEQQAIRDGILQQRVTVREKDQAKQQLIFMGAKIQYDGQEEIIPFIDPQKSSEYELSSKIKKLTAKNKPKIGFVSGHGEATTDNIVQAKSDLEILFELQNTTLLDSNLVAQFKTLVIAAPTDSFSNEELANLDRFVASGKGLLVAMNRGEANMQTVSGESVTTGLEAWLAGKGLQIGEDFVKDKKCGSIQVQRQQQTPFGMLPVITNIKFPYMPIISQFADHPVSKGIEQMIFPFASSISYNGSNSAVKYEPIAFTSKQSGRVPLPFSFQADVEKELHEYDFPESNLVVGATLEGPIASDVSAKMVVFSDGDFAVNGKAGEQMQRLPEDNINLFLNAVNWLSDDTGLNDLRTKSVSSRPIKKEFETDTQQQIYKWLSYLSPILIVLIYGFIRSFLRRSKRKKWANERYA